MRGREARGDHLSNNSSHLGGRKAQSSLVASPPGSTCSQPLDPLASRAARVQARFKEVMTPMVWTIVGVLLIIVLLAYLL